MPLRVAYSESQPVIHFDGSQDEAEKAVLTKSSVWRYEEEERVIDTERPPGIYRYDQAKILKSVIAGIRMSPENYARLQHEVQQRNRERTNPIELYRAREIPDKFLLDVPDHPRLHPHG